ncbi:hypothetical protein WICANDRAFT_63728 [Wickerhamomyces anomalus NRRL Y-366-8]|uniref:Uncharacterized protein n=1 Tax=Wickerhamomyces anomalus (strain ATCC 58044 / CBS 1984 / NCYC 433 / NRRL Y-366-8) TaxID=683960 RepID=A0A1E3P210_WICAA|nr:uncharacterized protein WICANDRAFT_63728 [Wickerhamomyces anomalus NRRL Y-366-8]ODQ59234.1 hypothetical protein WICANDRAFT_63728 [Wickerhamomyces anomalus NRRL Y-366-8]
MFPTAIRAFSRSHVAMNASAPTGKKAAVQWVVYFIGITAGLTAGAAVLLNDEAHKNKQVVEAAKPEPTDA